MFKNLVIRFPSLPKCYQVTMLHRLLIKKCRFWIFKTKKTRKILAPKMVILMKNEK